MEPKSGDKIQLIKNTSSGSVYGLITIKQGTILTVSKRNSSDDGIETVETLNQKNIMGQRTIPYNVWDTDYIILNN